ncbi:MAG: glycosyltransferase family 2 protein [Verrucomicrobia bacterium]|nr:glycosyltransferase family 2 protein [Verrucomicrobiota bacterium]
MPKISVIIPVYNSERYIERCLKSVLTQDFNDIEAIVVNDETPDQSMEIVSRIAKQDSRIRIIHNVVRSGPGIARKQGYEASRGDYLCFLDGDDTLPHNALEILYGHAVSTDAAIVKGNIEFVKETGYRYSWRKNSLPFGNTKEGVFQALLVGAISHNLAGTLFKRDLFVSGEYITIPGMTNGEDALLFYQIVKKTDGSVFVCDDLVYHYHENLLSSTHVKLSQNAIDNLVYLYGFIYRNLSDYSHIQKELIAYTVRHLNELYLNYTPENVRTKAQECCCDQFLSFRYRLSCLTPRENIRWCLKAAIYSLGFKKR